MKNFNIVTSRENSLIKLVSSLQTSADKRRENGLFVLEGLRICRDAAENGIRFDKLIISETAEKKYSDETARFADNSDNCYKIPDALFKKIGDTGTPQGIIAVCRMPRENEARVKGGGRYVALENISDPSNLGAIARTSAALGADGIILSSDGCDPYAPKVLRASMGTLLRMPVIITDDSPTLLKNNGITSYACVVDSNAESISSQHFGGGCAVLIGNEANGLTEAAKAASDKLVTVPMNGMSESLNAAAAAAIAVWEMMKNG